ncbi:MAG: hypothetical protein RSF40_01570 [Oscillospiraceae bacterium]
MEQRTVDIIKLCKHRPVESYMKTITEYMSKTCDCPVEYYNEQTIKEILVDAMMDYLNCCDRPSLFIYDMDLKDRSIFGGKTLAEKICIAFTLVQVRDDDGCVNGFNETYEEKFEE